MYDKVHWLVPTIGLKKLDKIKSSNNLLYLIVQQSTGNYLVFIPITTDDYTTSFTSDDQGNLTLRVLSTTTTSDQQDSLDVSFAIGLGPDNPYDISQICMNIIKEELPTLSGIDKKDWTRYLKTLCSSINNFPSTKTVINENEDAEINQQNGLNNSSTSYRRQVTLYVLMNLYRFHIILPSIVQVFFG
ncbi:3883_t:CDS:2 [Entrophospora sp. SA101]|nr:3883_t:CDS:2 [Entrophospora sp. SA101]